MIQNEKEILINTQIESNEEKQQREIRHKNQTEKWKNNMSLAEFLCCPDDEIYDLNIGGTDMITVSKRTLTKYPQSAISKMFNGKNKLALHNGSVFIDRDGKAFKNMIHYLRNTTIPIFINDEDKVDFYDEIDYWQIPVEGHQPKEMVSIFEFDNDWCAETLSIEPNCKIVKKNNIQHGIIFLKQTLYKDHCSVRLKVIINKPSRGKSHLFVGLVDKSKYKHEDLLSTFWKDSPSSYYWDIWNAKLIKTDSNGFQVETFEGYGCQCEESKTTITMKYNSEKKTVRFYKNNIDLGVAFRNVPEGLTPSLDIWFESGTIEIRNNKEIKDKIYL